MQSALFEAQRHVSSHPGLLSCLCLPADVVARILPAVHVQSQEPVNHTTIETWILQVHERMCFCVEKDSSCLCQQMHKYSTKVYWDICDSIR